MRFHSKFNSYLGMPLPIPPIVRTLESISLTIYVSWRLRYQTITSKAYKSLGLLQHIFKDTYCPKARKALCIKTHDSESRGQEETAIIRETKNTRPLSELFTRKSVKKLTNALVKPP